MSVQGTAEHADTTQAIGTDNKDKSASKVTTTTDELQYLLDFNASISQAMAKTMEHVSKFVFVSTANLTLFRRNSHLSHLRLGIKPDTLAALRTAPLQVTTLFPDSVIKRTEEEIARLPVMTTKDIQAQVPTRRVTTTLMNVQRGRLTTGNLTDLPGKSLVHMVRAGGAKGNLLSTHPDRPRASSHINDNYCVSLLQTGLLAGSQETVKCAQLPRDLSLKTMNSQTPQTFVHFAKGLSQKKDVSPVIVNCHTAELKYVKDVSCVDQLPFVKPDCRGKTTKLLESWESQGAGPKVLRIPFWTRPNWTRSLTVISCYANPHRNLYLLEALHQLMVKNAV